MNHTKPVRLYRFYNWEADGTGEPFRLCDECVKRQPVPPTCVLEKMADDCGRECEGVEAFAALAATEKTNASSN